jgi:hypothetical protein
MEAMMRSVAAKLRTAGLIAAALLAALALGCGGTNQPGAPERRAAADASASGAEAGDHPARPDGEAAAGDGGAAAPGTIEAAPGLVIERLRADVDPPVAVGDHMLTLVRVDPARYDLRLLTALADGGARPLDRWVADFGLTGAINASMFLDDRRSTGLMVRPGHMNNDVDNQLFGGFLCFDPAPVRRGLAAVAGLGRDCPGFDLRATRAAYGTVVQNYRILGCDGAPLPWQDAKAYSVAAIGTDRRGWFVLYHSRTPYRVTTIGQMLARAGLGLASLMFVEGGPEASLYVEAGGQRVSEIGSYETGFHEADDNRAFWTIPNVIGFAPRASDEPEGAPQNAHSGDVQTPPSQRPL